MKGHCEERSDEAMTNYAMNFLKDIIAVKQKEAAEAKVKLPQDKIAKLLKDAPFSKRYFHNAINLPGRMALIAEIKKSSPSKGIIREDFNPARIAKAYEAAGAMALSVLTDEQFFSGHNSFVGMAKGATLLPVLRKDFIIDEYQIYQSALIEADCILLIAELLDRKVIEGFLLTAKLLGLDVLVESNTENALDAALGSGAKLIGINNRNLDTFEVDIKTTEKLIKKVPKDRIIVSESGIKTNNDIGYLQSLGVNAVLIGETFMQAQDIAAKVKEVMGW